MRKLAFVLILTLVGCLNTTNHHPYRDGRSEEKPWWTTPYTADTPRDQNPWLKFVHQEPVDKWNNPWKYDDLRNYGVDVFPGQGVAPVKSDTLAEPQKKEDSGEQSETF